MSENNEYLPCADEIEREAEDDLLISQLAALSPMEYERQRVLATKKLGIERVGVLDKLVASKRKELASASKVAQEAEWPTVVDGAALLEEIKRTLNKYCHFPPHAADVLAVWILQTYCYQEFDFCALIVIWSAESECGKMRVLETVGVMANNPFQTANTSPAVLYHMVEKGDVTCLIDELDSQSDDQQEAIGNVLKSGFQSNGKSHRMEKVGEKFEVVEFPTFSPKAVATIGLKSLDKATRSRAIAIHMQRKPRHVKLEKFRRVDCSDIRRQCRRWVRDNLNAIQRRDLIGIEEVSSDRGEDIWEPLVVLGKIAGGDWEHRMREAASAISGDCNEQGPESLGHRVLFAMKGIFDECGADRLFSKDACGALNVMESESFKDLRHGNGVNAHLLSSLLKPYGISPDSIRVGTTTLKGYHKSQFEEAWAVYAPALNGALPLGEPLSKRNKVTTTGSIDQNGNLKNGTAEPCSTSENTTSTNKDGPCSDVPDQNAITTGFAHDPAPRQLASARQESKDIDL